MEGVAIGHNFERESPKDDSGQVWFKLAQWFQNLLVRNHLANFNQALSDDP
jgi:hypothetical protein